MNEKDLVARLQVLAVRKDRGALAALRRGLGKPPGSAAEMHPFVAPFLEDEFWTWRNQCHYIIAALFALHPSSTQEGNLGATFCRVKGRTGSDSVEKHFVGLLKCHRDDLFDHLRHAVSLAKAKDVPVNWRQLYWDMLAWDADDARVQRRWSQAYWGADRAVGEPTDEAVETEEKEKKA